MTIKKFSSIMLGFFIFIFLVVFGYFVYNKFFASKGGMVDLNPSNYSLLWSNKDFAKAEDLVATGNKESALSQYELLERESTSTDPIVRGQIAVRVATLYDANGDYQNALTRLFALVDNKDTYFVTRAFAYEYIARMVYDRRNENIYTLVSQKFGTVDTKSGVDKYALLALSVLQKSIETTPLYLAISKQDYIETEHFSGSIPQDRREAYLNTLRQTNDMITDIQNDPNVGYMLPLALLRKAQVIENIYSPGFTKETPEYYYEEALKVYDKLPQARGYNYVYYEYARYLAVSGGEKNKEKIANLLAHYANPTDEGTNLKEYLASIQKSPNLKQAKDYATLSKIQKVEIK